MYSPNPLRTRLQDRCHAVERRSVWRISEGSWPRFDTRRAFVKELRFAVAVFDAVRELTGELTLGGAFIGSAFVVRVGRESMEQRRGN